MARAIANTGHVLCLGRRGGGRFYYIKTFGVVEEEEEEDFFFPPFTFYAGEGYYLKEISQLLAGGNFSANRSLSHLVMSLANMKSITGLKLVGRLRSSHRGPHVAAESSLVWAKSGDRLGQLRFVVLFVLTAKNSWIFS